MWIWTKHQTIRPQAIQISLHLRRQNKNQQIIQDLYMSEIEITEKSQAVWSVCHHVVSEVLVSLKAPNEFESWTTKPPL